MRIYRRLQFGNLVDLSVLDTRQWRSDQACGDGSQTDCAEALAPDRTMMGAEQEKWLFDNLASREGAVDRPRPAGADSSRATVSKARSRRPLLDGQVGRLRRGAAASLHAAAGNQGAESDRALRRRAPALRRRSEDRLHEPAIGDRRRRVHEFVGDDDRRRQRGRPDVGGQAATTRTSITTATAAATSPARRRPRTCAPTSRSSTGSPCRTCPPASAGSLVVEAGRPGSNTD